MTAKNREAFLVHFCLYLIGSIGLLWIIYLAINAMRFNWMHTSRLYELPSLLILISLLFEVCTRPTNRLFLGALANRQLNEISQRQTLHTLVFIFGYMVISQEDGLSRVILGIYSVMLLAWTLWINRFGFRMVVRSLSSKEKSVNRLLTSRVRLPEMLKKRG